MRACKFLVEGDNFGNYLIFFIFLRNEGKFNVQFRKNAEVCLGFLTIKSLNIALKT